jgi:hypothetical protein
MNERIRKLAEQAGAVFTDVHAVSLLDDEIEKFAELIVRECIEHLESNVIVPNIEHSRTKTKCIRSIKEHFGVEE